MSVKKKNKILYLSTTSALKYFIHSIIENLKIVLENDQYDSMNDE